MAMQSSPCFRHLSAAMSSARRRMKASLLHAASSRGPSSSLAVCRAMSSAARAAPPRWFLPCNACGHTVCRACIRRWSVFHAMSCCASACFDQAKHQHKATNQNLV